MSRAPVRGAGITVHCRSRRRILVFNTGAADFSKETTFANKNKKGARSAGAAGAGRLPGSCGRGAARGILQHPNKTRLSLLFINLYYFYSPFSPSPRYSSPPFFDYIAPQIRKFSPALRGQNKRAPRRRNRGGHTGPRGRNTNVHTGGKRAPRRTISARTRTSRVNLTGE